MTYRCNPGYCLYGDARVRCNHKGFGKLPVCNRGCARPKSPDYGSIINPKSHYCPGNSLSYQCRKGYEMKGYANAKCQHNSNWDNKPPTCIKKCKVSTPPRNGYYVRSARPKTTYSVNEYVTVRCNTGYCGGGNMYCRHHGWDDSVSCHHGCRARDPPAHGSYVGSNRYFCAGDKATYKCKYGYEMQGHSVVTCNNSYSWDRPLPRCRRICHLPSAPEHGSFHSNAPLRTTYYEDDWVTVRCYSGYQIHGDARVQCGSAGWGAMPSCRYQTPVHPPHYGQPQQTSCKNKCGLANVGTCSCNHRCLQGYGTCCPDFRVVCREALASLSQPSPHPWK